MLQSNVWVLHLMALGFRPVIIYQDAQAQAQAQAMDMATGLRPVIIYKFVLEQE